MATATLKKPLLGVAAATALLLVAQAVAMQFSSEVSWGPGDFVLAAVLLFGAGALVVLGLAHVKGTAKRAAVVIGVFFGLALVWAELAVGLFS